MADNDTSELGFQQRGNSPSSAMHIVTTTTRTATVSSAPLPKSSNGAESIFGTGWDPHVSGSAMGSHNHSTIGISPYSVGMLGNSHILRYSLDPNLLEISPKLSSYGSGSFSAMVNSFGLPEYDQITNASCPNYHSTEETAANKNSRKLDDHEGMFRGDLQISDEGGSGSSPDAKKRKMAPCYHSEITHSQFQSGEAEHQRDVSQESIEGLKDRDAKKQKTEKNTRPNSRSKSTGAKDSSQNEQSSKEDYIHVRARRGQATNSHSLAERVRREKISQRMKYLQDLVPGCDKITGKALMLDEIINYVQSLQRQVEFLSMKLSTVNPEVSIDIERIMSKDILHSQLGGSTILGFHSGISSSQSQQHISSQGTVQGIHCTDSRVHTVPQVHTPWDDDFQNMIQMGLLSNPAALDSLGLNGKVGTS